jgi:hypothetical protein
LKLFNFSGVAFHKIANASIIGFFLFGGEVAGWQFTLVAVVFKTLAAVALSGAWFPCAVAVFHIL